LSALLLACAQPGLAQEYPVRPVKIVVAYTPGAENDLIARLAAQNLTEQLKQPFIVENKPGASGVIGADFVAKSAPDGYTLLLGNTTLLAILTNLDAKLPYQPQRDFEPVSIIATIPTVLVVSASLPVSSISELLAQAKAKPGVLNYASPGAGTPMHLIAELFNAQADVKTVHVPYKGAAPAISDLLAGQVHMMFPNVPSVLQHVRSGKLRAIATPNPTRLAVLPDVPTMAEVGIRDVEQSSWFAIVAPKGTPKPIVSLLGAEIAAAVKRPETRQKLQDLGADPRGSTPEETSAHMANEIAKWAKAVKASGIKGRD
jgi:tripartite-type tricarboxylate transporter receptor subunit TctC